MDKLKRRAESTPTGSLAPVEEESTFLPIRSKIALPSMVSPSMVSPLMMSPLSPFDRRLMTTPSVEVAKKKGYGDLPPRQPFENDASSGRVIDLVSADDKMDVLAAMYAARDYELIRSAGCGEGDIAYERNPNILRFGFDFFLRMLCSQTSDGNLPEVQTFSTTGANPKVREQERVLETTAREATLSHINDNRIMLTKGYDTLPLEAYQRIFNGLNDEFEYLPERFQIEVKKHGFMHLSRLTIPDYPNILVSKYVKSILPNLEALLSEDLSGDKKQLLEKFVNAPYNCMVDGPKGKSTVAVKCFIDDVLKIRIRAGVGNLLKKIANLRISVDALNKLNIEKEKYRLQWNFAADPSCVGQYLDEVFEILKGLPDLLYQIFIDVESLKVMLSIYSQYTGRIEHAYGKEVDVRIMLCEIEGLSRSNSGSGSNSDPTSKILSQYNRFLEDAIKKAISRYASIDSPLGQTIRDSKKKEVEMDEQGGDPNLVEWIKQLATTVSQRVFPTTPNSVEYTPAEYDVLKTHLKRSQKSETTKASLTTTAYDKGRLDNGFVTRMMISRYELIAEYFLRQLNSIDDDTLVVQPLLHMMNEVCNYYLCSTSSNDIFGIHAAAIQKMPELWLLLSIFKILDAKQERFFFREMKRKISCVTETPRDAELVSNFCSLVWLASGYDKSVKEEFDTYLKTIQQKRQLYDHFLDENIWRKIAEQYESVREKQQFSLDLANDIITWLSRPSEFTEYNAKNPQSRLRIVLELFERGYERKSNGIDSYSSDQQVVSLRELLQSYGENNSLAMFSIGFKQLIAHLYQMKYSQELTDDDWDGILREYNNYQKDKKYKIRHQQLDDLKTEIKQKMYSDPKQFPDMNVILQQLSELIGILALDTAYFDDLRAGLGSSCVETLQNVVSQLCFRIMLSIVNIFAHMKQDDTRPSQERKELDAVLEALKEKSSPTTTELMKFFDTCKILGDRIADCRKAVRHKADDMWRNNTRGHVNTLFSNKNSDFEQSTNLKNLVFMLLMCDGKNFMPETRKDEEQLNHMSDIFSTCIGGVLPWLIRGFTVDGKAMSLDAENPSAGGQKLVAELQKRESDPSKIATLLITAFMDLLKKPKDLVESLLVATGGRVEADSSIAINMDDISRSVNGESLQDLLNLLSVCPSGGFSGGFSGGLSGGVEHEVLLVVKVCGVKGRVFHSACESKNLSLGTERSNVGTQVTSLAVLDLINK